MNSGIWKSIYTVFDDIRFPLTGQQLTTSAGRLDYNFDECTVDFGATARYPEEPICMVAQMPHGKKFGTDIRPHIHWVQEQDETPNWLLAYRFYNNGAAIPSSFSLAAISSTPDFVYTSGTILQLSDFPHIGAPVNEGVSAICDLILYRDSANESGLFVGADSYSGTAAAKEFDFHIMFDAPGSRQEYIK